MNNTENKHKTNIPEKEDMYAQMRLDRQAFFRTCWRDLGYDILYGWKIILAVLVLNIVFWGSVIWLVKLVMDTVINGG